MFSEAEIASIDKTKYEVKSASAYIIEIKSLISGDYWIVKNSSLDGKRESIVIFHKHKANDEYHIQPRLHVRTLAAAMKKMEAHDIYRRKNFT